jgi:hypothetical protein
MLNPETWFESLEDIPSQFGGSTLNQHPLTASADGTARLWKANSGSEIKHIYAGSSGRPLAKVRPVGGASAKILARSPQEPANWLPCARSGNCHSS